MKAIIILLLLLLLFTCRLSAQSPDFTGLAPSLSVTSSVSAKLELNALATSKITLGENAGKYLRYKPQILEFYGQGLASYAIGKSWHIGAGYGFQRNNPFLDNWRNEHRLVQQIIYSAHHLQHMFYARIRFEERWLSYPVAPNNFGTRARFQMGYAMALHRDIYWQINDETFFVPSGNRKALFAENWLYSGIGFNIKYIGHVETGFGYDSNANTKGGFTNLLLLQIEWSYMIKPHDKNMTRAITHSRHF